MGFYSKKGDGLILLLKIPRFNFNKVSQILAGFQTTIEFWTLRTDVTVPKVSLQGHCPAPHSPPAAPENSPRFERNVPRIAPLALRGVGCVAVVLVLEFVSWTEPADPPVRSTFAPLLWSFFPKSPHLRLTFFCYSSSASISLAAPG